MRRNRLQRGFTLMELLVAISILAVTFASLMREGAQVSRNTKIIKDKTIAHWVAMNQAAKLTLDVNVNKSFPRMTTDDDTVEMAGMEWHVETNITESRNPFLREANIRVSDSNRKFVTDLSLWLRNPKP